MSVYIRNTWSGSGVRFTPGLGRVLTNAQIGSASGGKPQKVAGFREMRVFTESVEIPKKNIGLFWAYDGPAWVGIPSVLYNQAIRLVAYFDGLIGTTDIPSAARLFALCNLALADASIVAWEGKRRIKLWRPVLAIRKQIDEIWQPYGAPRSNPDGAIPFASNDLITELNSILGGAPPNYPSPDTAIVLLGASRSEAMSKMPPPSQEYARAAFTPNFPSYPSGHATFGGACFQTALNFRAERKSLPMPNNISVTLDSIELNGVTRDNYDLSRRPNVTERFSRLTSIGLNRRRYDLRSFTGANNASRIFLGVHWSFDQTDGDRVGRKVGAIVHRKAYRPRRGP